MFNRYDTSADGIITFEEFKAALSEANFSETTLKDMFESVVSFVATHPVIVVRTLHVGNKN